jgi:hypothetical protein
VHAAADRDAQHAADEQPHADPDARALQHDRPEQRSNREPERSPVDGRLSRCLSAPADGRCWSRAYVR